MMPTLTRTRVGTSSGACATGSIAKLQWADTNQGLTELASDVLGPEALGTDSTWAYRMLRARANSIVGGTTEVMKNILAERVLGLPRLR